MEDPSFQAFRHVKAAAEQAHVLHEHTDNAQGVNDLVEQLRSHLANAIENFVFDHVDVEVQPVRNVLRTEAGTLIARASRTDPPYRLRLEFSVRADREPAASGADYEVRCRGRVGRETRTGLHFVDFDDLLPVVSSDGSLTVDVELVREKISEALAALD